MPTFSDTPPHPSVQPGQRHHFGRLHPPIRDYSTRPMRTWIDPSERFWSKVTPDASGSGCWLWLGNILSTGYGQFSVGGKGGRGLPAHRIAYEAYNGLIAPGLQLDHLCRNTACVNPRHLEPVTCRVNILRGMSRAAVLAKRTHCPKGHPLSGPNLYVRPNGNRNCRACHNASKHEPARKLRIQEWSRAYYQRRKAEGKVK